MTSSLKKLLTNCFKTFSRLPEDWTVSGARAISNAYMCYQCTIVISEHISNCVFSSKHVFFHYLRTGFAQEFDL